MCNYLSDITTTWRSALTSDFNKLRTGTGAAIKGRMFTTGSLFSGGGGWEEGAKLAGGIPLWGIELDPARAAVWNRNNPTGHCLSAGVDSVDPSTLAKVDVLFTSPPCQGYSPARKARASKAPRADLEVGLRTVEFARVLRPKFVMLEEVPKYRHSPVYASIRAGLVALGYVCDEKELKADRYGLPSRRNRFYAVFSRDWSSWTWPTESATKADWWPVVADLPEVPSDPLPPYALASLAARPPTSYPVIISGAWSVSMAKGVRIFHTEAGRPCGPMTASPNSMTGYRIFFGGDIPPQRVTPRAAARLMGFPDSYTLPADTATAFTVVGNAVSPYMAKLLLAPVANGAAV